MSRVDAVRIALENAQRHGHDLRGAVLASDAFFPFADGPELALDAGITAMIQPGGSRRDAEVIAAVPAAGAAMVLHRPAALPALSRRAARPTEPLTSGMAVDAAIASARRGRLGLLARPEPGARGRPGRRRHARDERLLQRPDPSEADLVTEIDFSRVNSATGPIAVRGAEPGDSLVVELLQVRPDAAASRR